MGNTRLGAMLFAGAMVAGLSQASAADYFVASTAGPWDTGANPSLVYGVGDNSGSTVVSLTTGTTSVTITYVGGLVSAFGGTPVVDALGYVGGVFGSGPGLTGIGSSGQPFPSFFIDPTNSGPDNIWLAALIGAFTNSAGAVIGTPFAPGDGPFTISVPGGATELSLGVNDDIFSDNTGGWYIGVTQIGGVPEPATWAMMLLGFAGLGFAGYRRARAGYATLAA
jgi:hypothetical protein